MIDFNHTIVICLGLGNLSQSDMVKQCLKYDTKNDWSYGLSKEYLEKHAKDWYEENEMLKKECPKYKIPYYDTSKNRVETLKKIMEELVSKVKNP